MLKNNLFVRLLVRLEKNGLVVSFDDDGEAIEISAENGVADILTGHRDVGSVTVEVNDFYANGTVYVVYAATLADDDYRISEYWRSTASGNGKYYMFNEARYGVRFPTFIIGATPRRRDLPEPIPFGPGAAADMACQ